MQNTQPLRSLDSLDAAPSLAVQQALAQEKPFWTIWSIGGLILAIAVLIYSGFLSDLSFVELIVGVGAMANLVSKFFPPGLLSSHH